MKPLRKSMRSTWLCLLALLCACALPACSTPSTRPYSAPTPPPVVGCDRTPPPSLLPNLPLDSTSPGQMLEAMDQWALQVMAVYEREVTIRRGEHDCLSTLRSKGVIQ